MEKTLISPYTHNAKLGKGVATSYRPVGDASIGEGTCPGNCKHLPDNGGSCYTKKFLVNIQQRNSIVRNDGLDRLLLKGVKLIRLNTSGDFFKADGQGRWELDVNYLTDIVEWSKNHSDVTVYTYTHNIQALIDAGFSYSTNAFPANLHIVASCDTDMEKKLALEHGYRTARVIEAMDDKEPDETFCPYDLELYKGQKPKTTCVKCTLCFNKKHAKNIAFLEKK